MARIKIDAWVDRGFLSVRATELTWGNGTRRNGKPVAFRLRNYMDTKSARTGRHGSDKVFAAYEGDIGVAGFARDVWKMFYGYGAEFCAWSPGRQYGRRRHWTKVPDTMLMAHTHEDGELSCVLFWKKESAVFDMPVDFNATGRMPAGSVIVETGGQEND